MNRFLPLLFLSILCTRVCAQQNNCNPTPVTLQNPNIMAKNVLGNDLLPCCTDPMTGFYRDGVCNTGPTDSGRHVVCAIMTEEFLTFTKQKGNDLSTPRPEYQFPGLQPGDGWCLCAVRWKEAYDAGVMVPVRLESTHQKALEYVDFEALLEAKEVR